MITPDSIRQKSEKLWSAFLVSTLTHTPFFPKYISISTSALDYLDRIKANHLLKTNAKPVVKWGYTLVFHVVRKQGQGKQEILENVFFESEKDYLTFLGRESEFVLFQQQTTYILQKFPELQLWILRKPLKIIELSNIWERLIQVCWYFKAEYDITQPSYLRALPIPNVDTKFVEQHKMILYELLNEVLPTDKILETATGVKQFEKRFYLREIEPFVLVRQLETDYQGKHWSISELNACPMVCKRVFIVENQLSCILFPKVKESIVIFGKGYAVEILQFVKWLKEKKIYYWGDIDTNGFHILSILRGFLPQTESFLMSDRSLFDAATYETAKSKESKPRLDLPRHLTHDELQMYQHLLQSNPAKNRLEQEKLSLEILETYLQNWKKDL
jgi:hypothetical protein